MDGRTALQTVAAGAFGALLVLAGREFVGAQPAPTPVCEQPRTVSTETAEAIDRAEKEEIESLTRSSARAKVRREANAALCVGQSSIVILNEGFVGCVLPGGVQVPQPEKGEQGK